MRLPVGYKRLNPFDARILQVLSFALRPLTTSQVAQMSNISFNATTKHLAVLKRQGKVGSSRMGNRIMWFI